MSKSRHETPLGSAETEDVLNYREEVLGELRRVVEARAEHADLVDGRRGHALGEINLGNGHERRRRHDVLTATEAVFSAPVRECVR